MVNDCSFSVPDSFYLDGVLYREARLMVSGFCSNEHEWESELRATWRCRLYNKCKHCEACRSKEDFVREKQAREVVKKRIVRLNVKEHISLFW